MKVDVQDIPRRDPEEKAYECYAYGEHVLLLPFYVTLQSASTASLYSSGRFGKWKACG